MDQIKISHVELGTIIAKPNHKLDKKKKYMIKSLAFLQLVCMTPDSEVDENFDKFLDIISKTAEDARKLYHGITTETDAVQQF